MKNSGIFMYCLKFSFLFIDTTFYDRLPHLHPFILPSRVRFRSSTEFNIQLTHHRQFVVVFLFLVFHVFSGLSLPLHTNCPASLTFNVFNVDDPCTHVCSSSENLLTCCLCASWCNLFKSTQIPVNNPWWRARRRLLILAEHESHTAQPRRC